MSIRKLGCGGVEYYLSQVTAGVEDYYLADSEAPGLWLGHGADALGWAGEIDADDLRAALAGLDRNGARLARQRSKVPGFDVTLSAPKSVSLLWALGDRQVSTEVSAAHDEAVRQAISHLERHLCFTRRGKDGRTTIAGDGLVAAGFRHCTSGAGHRQLPPTC
ncbi:MAG TPA: MobF family relaxase [Acidimicrobiales bacterium]